MLGVGTIVNLAREVCSIGQELGDKLQTTKEAEIEHTQRQLNDKEITDNAFSKAPVPHPPSRFTNDLPSLLWGCLCFVLLPHCVAAKRKGNEKANAKIFPLPSSEEWRWGCNTTNDASFTFSPRWGGAYATWKRGCEP